MSFGPDILQKVAGVLETSLSELGILVDHDKIVYISIAVLDTLDQHDWIKDETTVLQWASHETSRKS